MSKVDSLIEHDYDGEDPVELSASKTVKEEVLPGRTIFEVVRIRAHRGPPGGG